MVNSLRNTAPSKSNRSGHARGGTVASADEEQLASRKVDALLIIDPDFMAKVDREEKPVIRVVGREGEENSKLTVQRLTAVLRKWKGRLKEVRFLRAGLPADFDSVIDIKDPQSEKNHRKEDRGRNPRHAGESATVPRRDVDAHRLDLPRDRHDRRREGARHHGNAPHQPRGTFGDRGGEIPRHHLARLRHRGVER